MHEKGNVVFYIEIQVFLHTKFLTANTPRLLYQAESIRPSLFPLLGLSATAP